MMALSALIITKKAEKRKPFGQKCTDIIGNTAQFVGSVGDAFSAICCVQIFRFTSSKPSKSAIASDENFIRLRTNSFVRYCLYMLIQPCDQVLVDLRAVDFVEHFMPSAGVELYGHVAEPRCAELIGDLGNAGAQ